MKNGKKSTRVNGILEFFGIFNAKSQTGYEVVKFWIFWNLHWKSEHFFNQVLGS